MDLIPHHLPSSPSQSDPSDHSTGPDPVDEKLDIMEKEDISDKELPCTISAAFADVQTSQDFPDGGFHAWVVVAGAFFISFSSWGYINSWGVFQSYYQQTILRKSSPSELAWIGSLQHCLIFLPGLIVGRLFDTGAFRIPLLVGSALIVAATFLVPLCKLYWQFLLCQGFAVGIGCGLVFPVQYFVIAHWWNRRRGFAIGVSACGGSVGGISIPIAIRQLLNVVGFAWTMRIVGFLLVFTLGIANLCVARRLPPSRASGGLFGWHVFRNPAFAVYALSRFVGALGGFTLLIYASSSAVSFGMSPGLAIYLVAIINAAAGFGRVAFGQLGDQFGAMNVLILPILVTAATTIAWPYARTVTSLIVVCVIYGVVNGADTALSLVPPAAMGAVEDLGRRMGTITTILGLGALCGPPLAGLLHETRLGYTAVGYFAGAMLIIAGVLIGVARFLRERRLVARC